ncbi:MAG TPA: hypothetical protein VGI45_13435 [Terracidiphilus sp.]|jgi:hypothetical protein
MNWLKGEFTRRHRYDEPSETIRERFDEKIADLMAPTLRMGSAPFTRPEAFVLS